MARDRRVADRGRASRLGRAAGGPTARVASAVVACGAEGSKAMKYKPFLSHKRQKAAAVTYLKQQLCLRGAGGWQDTAELPMGGQFINDIVCAIEEDTGGVLFWAGKGTPTSGG